MRTRTLIRLAVVLSVAGFATAALAASADDFKAAYAKAEAANKQAHALKNEWTTTASELKAAKGRRRCRQVRRRRQARQAKPKPWPMPRSRQAKEQETAWKQAVVR